VDGKAAARIDVAARTIAEAPFNAPLSIQVEPSCHMDVVVTILPYQYTDFLFTIQ